MENVGIYLLLLSAAVTAQNFRLSGDTKPTSYIIEISELTATTFTGRMTAEFEVFRTTKEIVLHENGLSFTDPDPYTVQLLPPGGGTIAIGFISAATKTDGTNQHVITVNTDLTPGNTYKLIIAYSGTIGFLPDGFYNAPHGTTPNVRFLGLTQFATTSARRAFPCWDEPAMKATFKLTVEYPREYTDVLSSQAAVGAPIDPDDPLSLMRIEFPTSAKMSPHSMSWAVMQERDKKSEGKITVWTRSGYLSRAETALQAAVASVEQLENYLNSGPNTPRNVDKLDLIAAEITEYNGLNNWGLQIYRETAMLFEADESSSYEYQRVWQTVAHEAARQWFGDLVTPAWWNEIWVSEGLNSYFEYWTLSMVQKEWQMDEQFVVQQTHAALQADWSSGTYTHIGKHVTAHPLIFTKVSTPDEIDKVFDVITYGKGSSIIRMLHALLGEDKFKEAIREFLTTNAEKTVTSDDLWKSMAAKIPTGVLPDTVTLKQVMDTWTKQPGFPEIKAERNYNNNTGVVTLTQSQFLIPPHRALGTPRWLVPVSISWTESTSSSNVWLLQEQLTVSLPSSVSNEKWLLLNKNHVGFYRVNYDTKNWQLLSESFLDLTPSTRAMLLDDALNLARGGRLDYFTALDVTELLPNETHLAPWSAALSGLGYLHDRLSNDTESRKIIESYILDKLVYVYDYVRGFNVGPVDSHVLRLTRQLVLEWACRLGHEKCMEDADALFTSWVDNPTPNPIDRDLRHVTYCTGIRAGGRIEFELVKRRYTGSSTPDKARIISALGCANDTDILAVYLLDSIDPSADINGRQVFTAVCQNPLGVNLALDFLSVQWSQAMLIWDGGATAVGKAFSEDLAPKLNTQEQLKQLKQLLLLGGNALKDIKGDIELAIGTLGDTLVWQEEHRNDVFVAMGGRKNPTPGGAASSMSVSVFLLLLNFILFIGH